MVLYDIIGKTYAQTRRSDPRIAGKLRHGLPESAFGWYLDLRRYGTFPHAGFGLGLERTVSWLCGISHLREAIPFPRTIQRLTP